jgi:hypothetical protein
MIFFLWANENLWDSRDSSSRNSHRSQKFTIDSLFIRILWYDVWFLSHRQWLDEEYAKSPPQKKNTYLQHRSYQIGGWKTRNYSSVHFTWLLASSQLKLNNMMRNHQPHKSGKQWLGGFNSSLNKNKTQHRKHISSGFHHGSINTISLHKVISIISWWTSLVWWWIKSFNHPTLAD